MDLEAFKNKLGVEGDAGDPTQAGGDDFSQFRDALDAGAPAGAPMESNAIADTGRQGMSDAPAVPQFAPRNPVEFGREFVMPETVVHGKAPAAAGAGMPGLNQYDKGVLSAYDTQARHQNELNDAEVGKQQGLSGIEGREANRQQQEANAARQDAFYAQQKAADYMVRTDKINEDIGAGRIRNPLENASTGQRIMFGIGAALGAVGGDIFGHGNSFMENLNKQIDRDISLQEKNLDNKNKYLQNRNTIYGQMHTANQDRESTNLQYRSAMLEAAKHQITSQVAANDVPSVRANGKLMTDKINMEQAQVKRTLFQQQQARAAAAAAAQRAAEAAQFERQYKMAELGLKADEIAGKPKAQTEFEKKQAETQQELAGQLNTFPNPNSPAGRREIGDVTAGTRLGNIFSSLGPRWAPGAEEGRINSSKREAYNTKLLVGAGAAYRWGSGGMEPKNHEVIEKMIDPYKINPDDSEAMAASKMEAFRRYLMQEAAGKGATPQMPASVKPR